MNKENFTKEILEREETLKARLSVVINDINQIYSSYTPLGNNLSSLQTEQRRLRKEIKELKKLRTHLVND